MLIDGVLLALAVSWLCGGRFAGLTQISLRGFWLIPTALLLRTGPATLSSFGLGVGLRYGPMAQVVGYLLLFAALTLNWRLPGMKLVVLGTAMNFIVIVANQGRMPVSPWALSVVGMAGALPALQSGALTTHGALHSGTIMWWLADIIPIPRPYPMPKIISIGDIVMVVGLGRLIMCSMIKGTKPPRHHATSVENGTVTGD